VITPYPIKYIVPWKMSDGVEVLLRPIRPEDEPLEQELLSTISEETLRTRFFSGFEVSHQRLVMFCNVDYDRHMAIVAEMKENERKKIIGVARLAVRPDHNSGEITVLVHDNFQRKGLGQKLMEMMIEIGRARGLNEIFGEVLTENKKTLKLCKKLGFATEWLGGVTKINLKLT
jgi:acetyltransferase